MSVRKVNFVPGEFYHLYNRGNSKQKIFRDKRDYEHFIGLLFACNTENNFKIFNLGKGKDIYDYKRKNTLVHIGAYCLMPNHFHLLISQAEDGSISTFMQKLCTAYVMYFNKKYSRTGGLFEGKFRSEHLINDRYLKYIFSYIHLNPIKLIDKNWKTKGLKDKPKSLNFLEGYEYSSYLDYLNISRKQGLVLSKKIFPNYFSTEKSLREEIFGWLTYVDTNS